MTNVLLITPPFTQLSSPYSAMPFLSGTLKKVGIESRQTDLGLLTALEFFSTNGLIAFFDEIEKSKIKKTPQIIKFISQKMRYINTIDSIILFLQGKYDILAERIIKRDFIPENNRFLILNEINLKNLGLIEKAKFMATLYIDDIVDLAKMTILPDFNLASYYERLAGSAGCFDAIYNEINNKNDLICQIVESILAKEDFNEVTLVGISVPFPGNLYSTLKIAKWLKKNYPNIK